MSFGRRLGPVVAWLALGVGAWLNVGCDSNADTVCESVADCERGGDSEWLSACQDEAKTLSKEADSLGCKSAFDDYYSCENDHFRCDGATASFPSCDSKRSALDTCIADAQGNTACAELSTQTSACGSGDGGAGNEPAPACTLKRDCDARCYLDHVANPCTPSAAELSAVADCAQSCPP